MIIGINLPDSKYTISTSSNISSFFHIIINILFLNNMIFYNNMIYDLTVGEDNFL
jgi:hypothetical protein